MKNKNIVYIADEYLIFYSKTLKKILKYKLNSKALKNGKIANIKLFTTSYKKFLKDYNLNNNLFGDTITIIVNPSYTKVDIDVITNVFTSLNYRKINIINEMKIYKFNSTNAYLNCNNGYYIFSYLDFYKEKHSSIFETKAIDAESLSKIIAKLIKKRNVFCFGLNPNIDEIIEKIEENSTNLGYHFSNDEMFLLNELLD